MYQIKLFLLGVFVAIVIMIPIVQEIGNKASPVELNLPEEWRTITHHQENPDTIACYLSRDTLYLMFIKTKRP